jgi:phosphohistidine swiveling domain-containing protein
VVRSSPTYQDPSIRIIAREHGIRRSGTGNATDVLKDGQRITVDGGAGVVELA